MAADDEVVVDFDANGFGGGDDFLGDGNIAGRGFWIAAGVVVQKSRRGRSPLNYLRKSVHIGRKGAMIGYSLI